MAVLWLVLQLTGSAKLMAAVSVAESVPYVLAGFLGAGLITQLAQAAGAHRAGSAQCRQRLPSFRSATCWASGRSCCSSSSQRSRVRWRCCSTPPSRRRCPTLSPPTGPPADRRTHRQHRPSRQSARARQRRTAPARHARDSPVHPRCRLLPRVSRRAHVRGPPGSGWPARPPGRPAGHQLYVGWPSGGSPSAEPAGRSGGARGLQSGVAGLHHRSPVRVGPPVAHRTRQLWAAPRSVRSREPCRDPAQRQPGAWGGTCWPGTACPGRS